MADKIKECHRLAREDGITLVNTPELFQGLLEIIKSDNLIDSFLNCEPDERRYTCQYMYYTTR
jgi:hypothetical protein